MRNALSPLPENTPAFGLPKEGSDMREPISKGPDRVVPRIVQRLGEVKKQVRANFLPKNDRPRF